jgi:translation initiation factor IF-3
MKNKKDQDSVLMNEDIRFKEVRCNAEDGTSHGIISSREAQALADEAGLDLVCIAPNATPPVVKIMNYGKFKYQQEKKEKRSEEKSKNHRDKRD